MFRFKRNGKSRDMGVGAFPAISLAEARRLSIQIREKLAGNIDPLQSKRKDQEARLEREITTFRFCAEQYIEAQQAEWKNAKHKQQWSNTLTQYAFPIIGDMPVAEVDTHAIEKVLNPIWLTKNETASRLRGRMERVLSWAKVKGYRSGENPAIWRGHLDKLLAKPSKVQKVKHHTALPYSDIPKFIVDLQEQTGVASIALELTILTTSRTGEVLGARWEEIDLKTATWTIPADRMKMGKAHQVPLSDRSIIIRSMLAIRTCELVFPSRNHSIILNNTYFFHKCFRGFTVEFTSELAQVNSCSFLSYPFHYIHQG
jgi:integrase